MVSGLVFATVWPYKSKTAPEATETASVALPNEAALPNCTVPVLIVNVLPAPNVFATFPKISVSEPALVRLKAPETIPLSVRLPLLPPMLLSDAKAIVPAYAAPVVLLLVSAAPLNPRPFKVRALVLVIVVPFKSRVAPDVTLTAPALAPRAVALPSCSVPALTVVPPE